MDEIASLDHELGDDTVDAAGFVALRTALRVFGFSSAELSEVSGGGLSVRRFGSISGHILGSLWGHVGEELHLDSA